MGTHMSNHDLEPYRMFRRGYDTLEIANLMQKPEHEIVRLIDKARSAARDLPYPFQPYSQPGVLVFGKKAYREFKAGAA